MSKATPVPRGEGQQLKTYNEYKRFLDIMSELTDDQLAQLHYEAWHHAYVRSNKIKASIVTEV